MQYSALSGLSVLFLSFTLLLAPSIHAQITRHVIADISHPFIVGQATLPPGHYIFRMKQHRDLHVMQVIRKKTGKMVEFVVRRSRAANVPHRNELVFNRYGNKDFLADVYQSGDQIGVAVQQPSREEAQLLKEGEKPVQHVEEQQE